MAQLGARSAFAFARACGFGRTGFGSTTRTSAEDEETDSGTEDDLEIDAEPEI